MDEAPSRVIYVSSEQSPQSSDNLVLHDDNIDNVWYASLGAEKALAVVELEEPTVINTIEVSKYQFVEYPISLKMTFFFHSKCWLCVY